MINRSWITSTLFFLVLAAAAGSVLRGMIMGLDLDVSYSHLLHAHSHGAILGWAYGALFFLLAHGFQLEGRIFKLLYIFSQLAVLVMFPVFTLQGYAPFSIALSTVHILLSYIFAASAWKRLNAKGSSGLSVKIAKVSLASLVLSSAGVWSLAIVSATGGKGSTLYDMALYFYLHFQYNGWLTIGLLAVFLAYMERKGISLSGGQLELGCWIYAGALIPSYLLSVLWVGLGLAGYAAAAGSALAQWLAVCFIVGEVYKRRIEWSAKLASGASLFLTLAGCAVFLKAAMELGLLFPSLWDLIYEDRNIVIGYLHLVLLGFVSFMCIGMLLEGGFLNGRSRVFRGGSLLFISGLALNEAVLFLQGLADWTGGFTVPSINEALLLAALLLTAGAGFWMFSNKSATK